MRKERLYLDTSVISYLDQQDTLEKTKETLLFWDFLKLDTYEILISDITMVEISNCILSKQQNFLEYLGMISYTSIYSNKESDLLANKYIEYTVLTEQSIVDCQHIALASIHECEYIVSWNFKHMANINTMKKVNVVNVLQGYKEVKIYPPTEFLYEEK